MLWRGVIEQYRKYLPVTDKTPVISLQEGNTPLLRAYHLEEVVSSNLEIYLKYEGLNPTASFKDRGMTVAVSKAVEDGYQAVICASTGNTSASAAAYAACAGIKCVVVVPEEAIALGKLSQALIHGARVLAIKGNFDRALEIVREIKQYYPIALVNSINPYRIEGQKTGAFEICDQLGGKSPDYHFIPVGNAGNITAYWKGYCEYNEKGKIDRVPKMLGFEAEGAAPIVQQRVIENPQTVATAIRIGNPASWSKAERAARDSGGMIDAVSDDEILETYRFLAEKEGVFVEPASAASVAGVIKLKREGYFDKKGGCSAPVCIVCILTGHGLKDPDCAIGTVGKPEVLPPTVDAVAKYIEQKLGIKSSDKGTKENRDYRSKTKD